MAKAGVAPEGIAASLGIVATLAGCVHLYGPRLTFRRLNEQPVRPGEVEKLLERCDEDLERGFLGLVRDAVRVRGSADVEENVQTAVRALAQAMQCLPVVPVAPVDTAGLRADAAEIERKAAAEPDPLTADALGRRARALLMRADTHDHSTLTVRRCQALRSEIEAEIEAVREGLAAQELPASATTVLSTLALAARQVAAEAADLTLAREELNAALVAPRVREAEVRDIRTMRG